MSSSTKGRTSEINTARQKRVSNVLLHIKWPFLERRSFLYDFRDTDFSLQGLFVWFSSTVLILSSYSSWRGRRIRSSQFTHVWVLISLWGAGWILHLIIFNYRSLQSTEKNVGQTSSTIFLFLAERHSKPDRWETSLKCVFDSLCSIWAPKLSSFQLNPWAPLVQEDKLERERSAQPSDPVQNHLGNTLRTQGLADLLGLQTG